MSVALRILLLIGALAMLLFVVKSIRKSRIQMKDALVWMLIALLIAIFGIFPSVPMWIAGILGIDLYRYFVIVHFFFGTPCFHA